ncbi:MAG: RNA methyltransferase [Desulfopila sp.]|jgi:tRNA/rRNA methyltransferase|nr:RNA methyltransferase [Desulfopila sp.]
MLTQTALLKNIAIVLVQPKFPENIGAAARSAFNMGLSRLILIRDEMPDHESMAKMATHKAAHLLDSMEIHSSIEDALAPFSYIIGTTARRGRQRGTERSPRQIVEGMTQLLPNNQIAFLFGPENCGLSNEELKYCHATSAIPTADFSSLNLAQAVAIHCYELYHGLVHEKKDVEPSPQYATSFELEGMYQHVEEALVQINFLEEKNHTYWMTNIRRFLARLQLTSKESNIIRGICRQFMWHQNQSGDRITTKNK